MGPMGSTGSGGGSTANVFAPPGQAAAAGSLGDIYGPLAGLAGNAGAGTPGGWAYPQAQSLYPDAVNSTMQYLAPGTPGSLFDTGSTQAYNTARQAGNLYGGMMPDIYNQIPGLTRGAGAMSGMVPQALQQGFNPLYGQMVDQTVNNPFFPQAMAGAQQGAQLGGQGAQNLQGMGSSIMNQAFDPQSALFSRGQQQLTDQSSAVNAMSGLAGTPYGAGVTSNALGNFDINWQNQQLGRETQGAAAASPLFQAAPSLAAGSAALPGNTYMNQISNVLNALKAQGAGGAQGALTAGALQQGAGQGLGQANSLGSSLASNTAQFGGLPYSTGATIGNNALSGLSNLQSQLSGAANIGNNQFLLPQQLMSDAMQYMGLGQSASQISGNLGQQGFNQAAQGLGGLLSGGNALFGGNGMLSGLGGGGFGGANLAGSAADASAMNAMMGFGGELAAPASGAFGGGLGSLLPMAMSA